MKIKCKFKKRDLVIVTNDGAIYSAYDTMAEKLGATHWIPNSPIGKLDGKKGRVINFTPHLNGTDIICLVALVDFPNEILIGEDGLRLLKHATAPTLSNIIRETIEEIVKDLT